MAEVDLAVAVLRRAVVDARSGRPAARRDEARAFIAEPNDAFAFWCDLAGTGAAATRARLLPALDSAVPIARDGRL